MNNGIVELQIASFDNKAKLTVWHLFDEFLRVLQPNQS